MLLNFRVSNFLSFNEEEEFSMVAGQVKGLPEHVVTLGEGSGELCVARTAVVYGANGSGKSNLMQAVEFFKHLVVDGLKFTQTSNLHFKLNKDNTQKNSKFEIEFSKNGKSYAYGIEVLLNEGRYVSEWLYGLKKTTDKAIFERRIKEDGSSEYATKPKFKHKASRDRFEVYSNDIKPNELLLFDLAEIDREDFMPFHDAYKWIEEDIKIIWPHSKLWFEAMYGVSKEEMKRTYSELLNFFNTGIQEIDFEPVEIESFFDKLNARRKADIESKMLQKGGAFIEKGIERVIVKTNANGERAAEKIVTKHLADNGSAPVFFEFEEESDGTKRLFDLIPILHYLKLADNPSVTFLVDEIDRSLHPELTRKFLELFLRTNPKVESQLILTTHESSLLDLNLLRRDEIWFVEKRKDGSSHLYSLEEFKPRFDLEIRKAYLQGRYGAIPFISDANQLGWN